MTEKGNELGHLDASSHLNYYDTDVLCVITQCVMLNIEGTCGLPLAIKYKLDKSEQNLGSTTLLENESSAFFFFLPSSTSI